mgnify:CR=1 FL=1
MQLQVASPDKSVVFDVVSAMDHLGNFSLDRNGTKMTIEQGILNAVKTPWQEYSGVACSYSLALAKAL